MSKITADRLPYRIRELCRVRRRKADHRFCPDMPLANGNADRGVRVQQVVVLFHEALYRPQCFISPRRTRDEDTAARLAVSAGQFH